MARTIEALLLFIMLPLVFYFELLAIQKIIALVIVTLVCVGILWADDSFDIRRLGYRPQIPGMWKKLMLRSALVALAIVALMLFLDPDGLFAFPQREPMIWGIVMLLYPLLSAFPQELIYRAFFFHRYEPLLGSGLPMIASSAGSFAFLHIIYDNEWAIILSLIGGFLFARTYKETQSLWWVSVEHALYGCIIFTIGMGNYFYEPF